MNKNNDPVLDDTSLSLLRERLWNMGSQLLFAQDGSTLPALEAGDASHYYEGVFGSLGCEEPAQGDGVRKLLAVGRALNLLERGRYGRCDACGTALDKKRLHARPEVLCCATCEGALQQRFASSAPRFSLPPDGRGGGWSAPALASVTRVASPSQQDVPLRHPPASATRSATPSSSFGT